MSSDLLRARRRSSLGHDLAGASCGGAAGTVALAAAQVGGQVVPDSGPPLQVLGDFIVRVTPVSVTEAVIRQVGRSDKFVLLVCVLAVAALAAASVGVLFSRGKVRSALTGIGVLVVLPALAATGEAGTSVPGELLVLVPAGALGAAVLWGLGRPLLTTSALPVLLREAAGASQGVQGRRATSRPHQGRRQLASRRTASSVASSCGPRSS